MKKGQIAEVLIEKVAFPNKGRGRVLGYVQDYDGVISSGMPGDEKADSVISEDRGTGNGLPGGEGGASRGAGCERDASSVPVKKDYRLIPAQEEEYVTVKNAAPGQRVLCRINKVRKDRAQAQLLRVLEGGPSETGEVACPHFGECGGCVWLSMDYDAQLEMKSRQVRDVLGAVVDENAGKEWFEGIKPSPLVTGYRNKMEFTFGDEYMNGPLALGMHRRGSFYDIMTVCGCVLVHPDFSRILKAVLDYFSGLGISYFHRVRHEGYLRYLLVRRGVDSGEILVDLVTSSQTEGFDERELLAGFVNVLRGLMDDGVLEGELVGVLHTRNDSLSDAVKDEGTSILFGRDHFYENLMGLRFRVSPFSFFQTNSKGAEVLYDTARRYALEAVGAYSSGNASCEESCEQEAGSDAEASGETEVRGDIEASGETEARGDIEARCETELGSDAEARSDAEASGEGVGVGGLRKKPVIYDLYSGTGTIAQMMSPVASRVIGVEIVAEAVEAARANAAMNGIDNCEFYAGDVLKVVPELIKGSCVDPAGTGEPDAGAGSSPDLIILDPPRDGIHPKALPEILSFNAPSIVYISCKVTSLARDLELIQKQGYRLVKAVAIDHFPQTANIEACVLLSKTSEAKSEIRDAAVPASAERESGTSYDMLERIQKAKDYVEIGVDAEEYYRIKDSETVADE